MRKLLLILLGLFPSSLLAQDYEEEDNLNKGWRYHGLYMIEVQPNYQNSVLGNTYAKGSGFGLELNTFQGLFITKRIVLAVGSGLNFNFNKNFQSIPIIAEAKIYYEKYGENGIYIMLNAGRNLPLGGFDNGQTAKLGAGYVLRSQRNYSVCIEVFKKSKFFDDPENAPEQYGALSYGLAVGFRF